MFGPIEGKDRYVRDHETGVMMFIKDTPELQTKSVHVQYPTGEEVRFSIGLEPKYPDRTYVPNDQSNPMIRLLVGSFGRIVESRLGSYEENSRFVRYLLEGLSAINRRWPLCGSPFFYSDLDDYLGRENVLQFSFPSDDEIAKL